MSIMGELAASLAHELLHPVATARNNARAGMRFLEMSPPNMAEVKEALGCIVRDADRAKDIIGRMRDHIKKAPPRKQPFDLNEAIREVIVTVRSAIDQNRVSVRTRLGRVKSRSGRSCSTATSHPEFDLERHGGNELRSRRARESYRSAPSKSRRAVSWSLCKIQDRASTRSTSSRSSRPFTRPRQVAWAWGSRFAGPSSPPMGVDYGQRPIDPSARNFNSLCRRPDNS